MDVHSLRKPCRPNPQMDLHPFEQTTRSDYLNVISTVAFTALLLVALGLSIHYGFSPKGQLIPFSSNFSMCLPLLVTTSSGALMLIFLGIQICRKKVLHSYERMLGQIVYSNETLKGFVRKALHPGGRKEGITADMYIQENETLINDVGDYLNAKIVSFETEDGLTLKGFWEKQPNVDDAPTVILLHGNGMVAEDMFEWGDHYLSLGFNVFIPEYRGYGMSEGEAAEVDQEKHAHIDAKAFVAFLESKHVNMDKVLAHGYSLGGAYAATLGFYCKIPHLVLDHTFTSYPAVLQHVIKESSKSPLTEGSANNIVGAAYLPSGRKNVVFTADVFMPDGWDSLRKVREGNVDFFVIQGDKDQLMPTSFGEQFAQIYSEDEIQKARLATIEGGHCDFSNFFKDESASNKLTQFLKDMKLIKE